MSLQEMIELAILDAMGLLDEREQAAFETAFRTASPAVQAQVRREQTRLSRIEALLPDVTPPAGLRAAVIQAVRAQIAATQESDRNLLVPTLFRSRGVTPIWRAAALGLAAAAVVLSVTTFQLLRQYDSLEASLRADAVLTALREEFGASYVQDVLFSQDTKRVLIRPVAQGFSGEASIFINPEWKAAKFFGQSITTPDGQSYRLAIINDNDEIVRELGTIDSDGRLFSKNLTLAASTKGRIAIVGPASDPGDPPVILGRGELAS